MHFCIGWNVRGYCGTLCSEQQCLCVAFVLYCHRDVIEINKLLRCPAKETPGKTMSRTGSLLLFSALALALAVNSEKVTILPSIFLF
jgi:hypothetical protein